MRVAEKLYLQAAQNEKIPINVLLRIICHFALSMNLSATGY